jgi:hypothetical protein
MSLSWCPIPISLSFWIQAKLIICQTECFDGNVGVHQLICEANGLWLHVTRVFPEMPISTSGLQTANQDLGEYVKNVNKDNACHTNDAKARCTLAVLGSHMVLVWFGWTSPMPLSTPMDSSSLFKTFGNIEPFSSLFLAWPPRKKQWLISECTFPIGPFSTLPEISGFPIIAMSTDVLVTRPATWAVVMENMH